MYDAIIRGGMLVDGTGEPMRRADIALSGDKVVAIGDIDDAATLEIDARDRVVAPGFTDIHTHYDAQLMWDPSASPSVLHGVTTVIGGNCGFGIAPVRPDDGGYLARMLSRVEGMPLRALEAGLTFDWSSFGEWLNILDGTLTINAGFLAGHSTMRRVVMQDRVGEQATEDEVRELEQLLRACLSEGALGFSTSLSPTHNGADGQPVPSRLASVDELVRLAAVVRDFSGSVLEMIPPAISPLTEQSERLMRQMSAAAGRPLNWNLLKVAADGAGGWSQSLARCGFREDPPSDVVALSLPELNTLSLSLADGFLFDAIDEWGPYMALNLDERIAALRQTPVRATLRAGALRTAQQPTGRVGLIAGFRQLIVAEVLSPKWERTVGRSIGSIADEMDMDPLDVLLDIALDDSLATRVLCPDLGDDTESWLARAEVWRHDDVVLGGSDAGAHVDVMCGATYTTSMLGQAVRERGLLTLEHAVHLLSAVPARLYGLTGRGTLREGSFADIVIFDPATVSGGIPVTRHDLPANSPRLFSQPNGVDTVIVNGVVVVQDGELTGTSPGHVLRRGTATTTRTPGSWRSDLER